MRRNLTAKQRADVKRYQKEKSRQQYGQGGNDEKPTDHYVRRLRMQTPQQKQRLLQACADNGDSHRRLRHRTLLQGLRKEVIFAAFSRVGVAQKRTKKVGKSRPFCVKQI